MAPQSALSWLGLCKRFWDGVSLGVRVVAIPEPRRRSLLNEVDLFLFPRLLIIC